MDASLTILFTSCSLTITENADPDVRRDLETIIARLAPDGDAAYRHNDGRVADNGTGIALPCAAASSS